MRIAHIIAAHKNPLQIERLITAMHHPNFDFYIHLDKKVAIAPFQYLEELGQVYFIKDRTLCNWGGFSFVEAQLRSIDEIQATGLDYNFINLISAQDYPIVSADKLYEFFLVNNGSSFISYDRSRNSDWWKEAENRYKSFHFTDMNFKMKYLIQKIANKLISERKFPLPIKLYGGNRSCWWTITSEAAAYLSAYFKANPKMMRFLRLTWGSDEFIMASILMNSPYKDKLVNENYRYIDWSGGKAHPEILKVKDAEAIIHSGMLFARKFDLETDSDILHLLDQNILSQKLT
ncbi:beta-1,6-N-acetylglucosaminyltransferase [Pedobacter sp. L105]|uniref:beta-1,6-N-acetylglucosaminyltransferase n=1 Tax=Pedobacter sp. L105 TaxID=1641871 RepID=UPI00131E3FA8|nr:beta-1,6-N-acetylglucosaminyltransferase [Pedobacter sp. L105]